MLSTPRTKAILRYGRVAFSVAWGTLCLLAIVFWARSYWYEDYGMLAFLPAEHVQVYSTSGPVFVSFEHKPARQWADWSSTRTTIAPATDDIDRVPWLRLAFWPTFARLYLAHWFLAVVAGGLALAPWYQHKFSLRTLMLAVTVLALIAGVILGIERTF
jgi:hypothetical protein